MWVTPARMPFYCIAVDGIVLASLQQYVIVDGVLFLLTSGGLS